jgi:hypothetical protein
MCRSTLGSLLIVVLTTAVSGQQSHDHGAMSTPDGKFNPWIVSDGKAGFYVAYVQRDKGASNVMLQHSANGQLSTAVRVNDRPGDGAVRNENPPKIAIGPAGEVFVVWANERERWKGNIRFSRSTDGGRTFAKAIDLNSGASLAPVGRAFESITVDGKGRIYVAWLDERNKTANSRGAEIWMATSDDGGKTFSPDHKIVSDVCECCRTALVTDKNGTVFISYRMVPANGPMLRDIVVARSVDGGKTFSPTIVSKDGWDLNACPIAGATMAMDLAGNIHVVWFTEDKGTPSLLYASSSDGGKSFGPARAFDPGQKLAKHAHVTAIGANQIAVAWDDILDGKSVVKYGILDGNKPLRLLGSQPAVSYPVIAATKGGIEVVGLSSDAKEIARIRKPPI